MADFENYYKMAHRLPPILTILTTILILGYTGENGNGVKTTSIENDSTFLPNGYNIVDLFKTRTDHLTISGKTYVFLIDTGGGATLIDMARMDISYSSHQYPSRISVSSLQGILIPIEEFLHTVFNFHAMRPTKTMQL